jgi:subtilisin family serine protease/putative cell wall-binding protein
MRRRACAVAATGLAAVMAITVGAVPPAAAAPSERPVPAPTASLQDVLSPRPVPPPQRLGVSAQDEALPGVLLVTTTDAAATERVRSAAAASLRGGSVRALAQRVAQVQVPSGQEPLAAATLSAQPGVLAVEPARSLRLLAAPNDELYPQQWAHRLSRAERAWDVTTGSATVTVAVIDNGVDGRQPDLTGNLREQRVFRGGSSTTVSLGSDNRQCAPDFGRDHGTHVAGIVGAQGDDGLGVAGVAWNVALLDYAVFTPSTSSCGAREPDVLAAVQAAAAAGVDVVNLSLGGPADSCGAALQAVLDEARDAGTVVVAAAGNHEEIQPGRPTVPASCNGVISVGAARVDGSIAPYSTANDHVDLAAPGGDVRTGFGDGVLSTFGDGQYQWLDGTSMASPYVAGVAALLRAAGPGLTPDQVEGLLEATADDRGAVGRDPYFGHGLVDAGAALEAWQAGARPVPEQDPVFPVGDGGGGFDGPPPAEPQLYRVTADPHRTEPVTQAVAMSQATFDDGAAAHAVLARRDDFADALAGSSLGLGLAPLLFSGSTGPLPDATRGELLRTLPPGSTVYLLGGTAALPETLEEELRSLGFAPVRLAGTVRESTAVAVGDEVVRRRAEVGFPDQDVVLLATGRTWPDAVAAGSFGAYYGLPILLTPTHSLHPATESTLNRMRPSVLLVLGGTAAVSEQTYAAAARAAGTDTDTTFRVAGEDRYATAVGVAGLFEQVLAFSGLTPRCVIAADLLRADGYAHVLSASVLAGAFGCVIVGAGGFAGEQLPAATRDYVQGFGIDGVLAGGTDVVSDAAGDELLELLRQ